MRRRPGVGVVLHYNGGSHSRLGMKRVIASLCICWAAFCGTQSNTAPLVFGMTPQEASIALGVPLVYYAGGPGSEIYLAYGSPGVPGFYPVDSALALQFRNGAAHRMEKGLAAAPAVAVLT